MRGQQDLPPLKGHFPFCGSSARSETRAHCLALFLKSWVASRQHQATLDLAPEAPSHSCWFPQSGPRLQSLHLLKLLDAVWEEAGNSHACWTIKGVISKLSVSYIFRSRFSAITSKDEVKTFFSSELLFFWSLMLTTTSGWGRVGKPHTLLCAFHPYGSIFPMTALPPLPTSDWTDLHWNI